MSNATKTEGAEAFDRGTERHACPYDAGSEEFHDWVDGWAQRKAWREKNGVRAEGEACQGDDRDLGGELDPPE
ncbi:hypothetical protein EON81_29985 [bacterium]|nr:MAG: hypothetical protein EON81_29985 [bacterium]